MAGAGRGRQAGKAGLATRAQAFDLAAEDVDPNPQRHGGRSPLVPAGPELLAGCLVPVEEALVDTIISTIICSAYVASRAAPR